MSTDFDHTVIHATIEEIGRIKDKYNTVLGILRHSQYVFRSGTRQCIGCSADWRDKCDPKKCAIARASGDK